MSSTRFTSCLLIFKSCGEVFQSQTTLSARGSAESCFWSLINSFLVIRAVQLLFLITHFASHVCLCPLLSLPRFSLVHCLPHFGSCTSECSFPNTHSGSLAKTNRPKLTTNKQTNREFDAEVFPLRIFPYESFSSADHACAVFKTFYLFICSVLVWYLIHALCIFYIWWSHGHRWRSWQQDMMISGHKLYGQDGTPMPCSLLYFRPLG